MRAAQPGQVRRAFGEAVRHFRLARGLSQEALGDLAGIHRTYVGDVERGKRNLGLENVARLAAALAVSTSELFAEVDRRSAKSRR